MKVMSGTTVEIDSTWVKCEVTLEETDWTAMAHELAFDPHVFKINDKFRMMENRTRLQIWMHLRIQHGASEPVDTAIQECLTRESELLAKYR